MKDACKILGISAYYHDSAAALLIDGNIIAAAQEERFNRKKHSSAFPTNAIKYCLEEGCLELNDLDYIVFYDKPLLKFERLIETYYSVAPRGLLSFLKTIPVWLKDKLFLKKIIINELKNIDAYDKQKVKLLFSEHHLSHMASAFFPSAFKEAAILSIDGVGEWSTAVIGSGNNNVITIHKELHFPHSVGLLYSSFTFFLGFTVNSGEYKLMGLAPYGNPHSAQTAQFEQLIKQNLVDIKEDGSIWLNQLFFNYTTGLTMINAKKWEQLFGFPKRQEQDELLEHHCNLALAIQNITEEIVIKMAKEAKKITGSNYLCMAGGVALNAVSNGKLLQSGLFKEIFIQPAAGDAGGALGAALAVNFLYLNQERVVTVNDGMKGALLGPQFSDEYIEKAALKAKATYRKADTNDALVKEVATLLKNGKVVAWFQGRMEFGPRSLGNRSILADPTNKEMQKKVNLKVKFRESFRPFAPSVLSEDCNDYFEINTPSPYMLLVASIQKHYRNPIPENFHDLPLKEKLGYERSQLQAITHVDFSARIQTVDKNTNPIFRQLIEVFKQETGIGLLLNTSFNVRGEPVVCTPEEAYTCFMNTDIDYLVMNRFVFCKEEQAEKGNKKWATQFNPD